MRKTLPILITFIGLLGAFFLFLRFQPRFLLPSSPALPAGMNHAVSTTSQSGFVGPGKGVWVTQFDRETGKLAYRFKADFYDRHADRSVAVTRPVIEFFLAKGQIVHVEGVDGILQVTSDADRDTLSGVPVEPPRAGVLRDVTIRLFDSAADQVVNNVQMTMTMDNCQFDNDTFRLFTQEYTNASGNVIHADEVPVHIRARTYSFDGSGLVMYWNDFDRHLKSLEIAHGKQLMLYDSTGFQLSPAPTQESAPQQSAPQEPAPQQPAPGEHPNSQADPVPRPRSTLPAVLVQAGDSGAAQLASDVQPATRPAPDRYIATFYQNVRVMQDGQMLVHGDTMDVDFCPGGQEPSEPTGNSPAPSQIVPTPAPPSAAAPPAVSPPSAAPSASLPATAPPLNPAPSASASPATPPPPKPIEVYWDGKMRMVPMNDPAAEPLAEGQSKIRIVGAPVALHHFSEADGSTIDAVGAEFIYHSVDRSTRLVGDKDWPMVFQQQHQNKSVSKIFGKSLQFSRLEHVAVIEGPGKARLPQADDPSHLIDAQWDKTCLVHLIGDEQGPMHIRDIHLVGQAAVDDPRFSLTADELTLSFDAPAQSGQTDIQPAQQLTSTPLRQVDATGDALCIVHETNNESRSISGQELKLITSSSNGRVYAKTILADGSVQATRGTDRLSCEHLMIALAPKSKQVDPDSGERQNPSHENLAGDDVELQQLIATDSVQVVGKNSSSAAGDKLQIDMTNGHAKVTLTGKPIATATDNGSTISGPKIVFSAVDQTSSVDGPGNLVSKMQPQAPKDPNAAAPPARNVNVSWTDHAVFDGKANQIRVFGDVNAESKTDPHDVDLATGKKLTLALVDKPQPAGADPPPQDDFSFMRNKEVRSLVLKQDAHMESYLTDAAGTLLRQSDLYSDEIDYDTQTRTMTVPGAGRMLSKDDRPPAAAANADPNAAAPLGGRGTTAFQWSKQMVYDETKRVATLDGSVRIVHRDPGPQANQTEVDADTVTAIFQPDPNAPAAAANPTMQINQLTADGHVRVLTDTSIISCDNAVYDPAEQTLTCRRGPNGPVTLRDPQHTDGAEFGEVVLNTKTNLVERMTDVSARFR